jgi:hypothetical protein
LTPGLDAGTWRDGAGPPWERPLWRVSPPEPDGALLDGAGRAWERPLWRVSPPEPDGALLDGTGLDGAMSLAVSGAAVAGGVAGLRRRLR